MALLLEGNTPGLDLNKSGYSKEL